MTHLVLQLPSKNYLFESQDFEDCYSQLVNMFTADDAEKFRLENGESLWSTLESMIIPVTSLDGIVISGYLTS
jgi:hypothetical protein